MQSYRLITVATLVDRLKINGSLARKALSDLEEKGQIKKVVRHSKLSIYSTFCCLVVSDALYWGFFMLVGKMLTFDSESGGCCGVKGCGRWEECLSMVGWVVVKDG